MIHLFYLSHLLLPSELKRLQFLLLSSNLFLILILKRGKSETFLSKGIFYTLSNMSVTDSLPPLLEKLEPLAVPLDFNSVSYRSIDKPMSPNHYFGLLYYQPRPWPIDNVYNLVEELLFTTKRYLLGWIYVRIFYKRSNLSFYLGYLDLLSPEFHLLEILCLRFHHIECGRVVKGCPHHYGYRSAFLNEPTRSFLFLSMD